MKSNKKQYTRIFAALSALGWDATVRTELVPQFAANGGTSLTDLTAREADELITWLNKQQRKTVPAAAPATEEAQERDRIRKKILACAHNLGWYRRDESNNLILIDGQKMLDYDRIDQYCLQRTAAKKKLNEMDKKELQKAAYQFNAMLISYTNK